MASTAQAFVLSRFGDLFRGPSQRSPQAFSRGLATPNPGSSFLSLQRRRPAKATTSFGAGKVFCLVSDVHNDGVSDDFASKRREELNIGFSTIAKTLKGIKPLDMSVMSHGVSDSAKEAMIMMFSSMLGMLPSDHFAVSVWLPKGPFYNLVRSSIMTGYVLWNAEYRLRLNDNLDILNEDSNKFNQLKRDEDSEIEKKDSEVSFETKIENLEAASPQVFRDLSPQEFNYIQKLQSELSEAEKELNAQKQENKEIESNKDNGNDLLKYLRSLDDKMMKELSSASSLEVKEIVHQLCEGISSRFFIDLTDLLEDLSVLSEHNKPSQVIKTDRDYLANLLFWCMLLGHRLRHMESIVQLSCARI